MSHCDFDQLVGNMFSKLVVVALFLAVANSAYTGPLAGGQSAAQFPAGIDPQACPNYPICENPSVAVNQVAASAYASPYQTPQYSQAQYAQPQYTQPQYSQQQYAQPQYAQPQLVQSRYTSSPVQQYNPQQPAVQLQQRQYNLAQPQFAPNQAYKSAQPQYPSHLQAALDRGEYIGDGDYHGEGLAESGAQAQGPVAQAYNPASYQQAYSAQQQYQAAAQIPQQQYQVAAQIPQQQYQAAAQPAAYHGGQQPAQLPAGLAPGACPNYPFCQQ